MRRDRLLPERFRCFRRLGSSDSSSPRYAVVAELFRLAGQLDAQADHIALELGGQRFAFA